MRFILLLLILFFASCNGGSKATLDGFMIVKDLSVSDSIELEDYNILNPYGIHYAHDMLMFMSRGKNGLQVLDLKNYKTYTLNLIGEGPDEVSMFNIIRNNHLSLFHFIDPNTRKILEFKIDNLRLEDNSKPFFWMKMPGDTKQVFLNGFENENFIFYTGHLDSGRFLSYNKLTGKMIFCGEFPKNDQIASLSQRRKESVYNGTIMTGNESCFAACYSGLIDFYKISPDGILYIINKYYYHFPTFIINNGNGPVVSYSSEDKVGFTDIDSYEYGVFTLYSDKSFKEYRERAYNCESLFMYDWEGNPQCEYRLEKSLYSFAVSGKRIYGLSRENAPKVYIYELK